MKFIDAFTKCVRLRRHMNKFGLLLFTRFTIRNQRCLALNESTDKFRSCSKIGNVYFRRCVARQIIYLASQNRWQRDSYGYSVSYSCNVNFRYVSYSCNLGYSYCVTVNYYTDILDVLYVKCLQSCVKNSFFQYNCVTNHFHFFISFSLSFYISFHVLTYVTPPAPT